MSIVSLSVVSEIAIVPESECRIPTLMSANALDVDKAENAVASSSFFILKFLSDEVREDAHIVVTTALVHLLAILSKR
ncbi:hypothetical protein RB2150_08548 [Rhodobacterales bacterium HTCC2150]|nr:hypothetical protein RB2150_08548 [Rhodobacterales bacterium HTCC2150] [Rhodobacteraceae bacterium HTCC2150]